MRFSLATLVLSLCVAFPIAAHADSFEYTLTTNYPNNSSIGNNVSALNGTFTFDEPSLLTGLTYIYAPDFTEPAGSTVSEIQLGLYPSENYYYFTLYTTPPGVAGGSSLLPPVNGVYNSEFSTLVVTDLGPSQVPEPSSIILICTGALGLTTQVRRRITRI